MDRDQTWADACCQPAEKLIFDSEIGRNLIRQIGVGNLWAARPAASSKVKMVFFAMNDMPAIRPEKSGEPGLQGCGHE
jgi:hypothetical protein